MNRTIVTKKNNRLICTAREFSIHLHYWKENIYDIMVKKILLWLSNGNLEIDVISDTCPKSFLASGLAQLRWDNMGLPGGNTA
jgi:hypothetical protein